MISHNAFAQFQYPTEDLPDPDAQAFFDAVTGGGDTLTQTEKDAVDALVVALKADSIWDDILYAYPFVGGTATAHKWNLKDPQNTDAAYRLDFGANITHNSDGIIGTAGNSATWADTHYNPNAASATGHTIAMYFNQGLTATPSNWYDYGAYDGTNDNMISMGYNNKTTFYAAFDGVAYKSTTGGTYGASVYAASNDNTNTAIYQDGSSLLSSAQSFDPTNRTYYLLANNRSSGASEATGRGIGIAIGYDVGLDSTEHSNLSTAITTCMTSLGRN
jgi:hypothetical protein